jgi:hypothetical protein
MRCVGIYPVGTLVLLESGRLGVVVEPHETSLLTPKVNVFYSTKSQTYIKPQAVDLTLSGVNQKNSAVSLEVTVCNRPCAMRSS